MIVLTAAGPIRTLFGANGRSSEPNLRCVILGVPVPTAWRASAAGTCVCSRAGGYRPLPLGEIMSIVLTAPSHLLVPLYFRLLMVLCMGW